MRTHGQSPTGHSTADGGWAGGVRAGIIPSPRGIA
jgi:hypothetical protein